MSSRPKQLFPWKIEPEPGRVFVVQRATHSELAALQRHFAGARAPDSAESHWDWGRLGQELREVITLVEDSTDLPVAVWGGRESVMLRDRRCYQLDFLEIHGAERSRGIYGPAMVALLANHVLDGHHTSVVLGSLVEREAWYRRIGAVDEPDFEVESGLVSLSISTQELVNLARSIDDIRV